MFIIAQITQSFKMQKNFTGYALETRNVRKHM